MSNLFLEEKIGGDKALLNKGFMIDEFSSLYHLKTVNMLSRICQRAISDNKLYLNFCWNKARLATSRDRSELFRSLSG